MRAAVRLGVACVADGLLRYHRETRKMTTRKTRTWGMLIDCSAMLVNCACGNSEFVSLC
jgi:hypothetical protein